jgi:chromosome segregation protein
MHIKRIILKNFKSFGKKVEIPFEKGFIVISGPNGSGKSNIIDSILFCLGLSSSSRVLRAEKLTDLVHSGNGRQVGEAEVTIIFDNSDGRIDIDEEEIRVTRKIRVTEKGYYSYYYLNGKSVNLSEIQRILEQAGIHSDAYNVIMQGDVTRITEMTPLQRRKIIDDIAGISDFDEKKERALEELERVRENIELINTVLTEVNVRLSQLDKDREEALRYKSLVNEKERLLSYLTAHKYLELSRKKQRVENEIQKLEIEKDRLISQTSQLSIQIDELKREAEEISKEIVEKGDEDFKRIQEELVQINGEIEAKKKEIEIFASEIKKLESEKTGVLVELSKLKEDRNTVLEDIEKAALQKMSLEEVVSELESKIELLKLKIEEMGEQYGKLRDELLSKREELEKLKEEKSLVVRERDRLLEAIRRIGLEIDSLNEEKRRDEETINQLLRESMDKARELENAKKEIQNLEREVRAYDDRLFSLRSRLADLEEEIKQREVELAKIRAELSTIQSGFSRAVELVMEARDRKALPGIYGTVAQLGEVDSQYALAIEVAAGNALQYIVVETEEDAIRAINYLKQIRGGRATFLPLNKIKKNFEKLELNKDVLSKLGVIDYAVNLIRFDKKFRAVFNFILRDTLVVDNLENAKKIMDGRRIVTLDGDLIERSGAMTGGSIERKHGLLVSRELIEKEKKINEEITVLKSEKASMLGEIKKVEDLKREVSSKVNTQKEKTDSIAREISAIEARISEIKRRLSDIDERIKEKTEERERIYAGLSNYEAKISEFDSRISTVSNEIQNIEKELKGSKIPEMTKKLEELKEEHARYRESLLAAEAKIGNLELKKNQVDSSIEEREKRIVDIDDEIARLGQGIKDGEEAIQNLYSRMKELKEKEKEVGVEIKELRKKRDDVIEKLREAEKKKDAVEFEVLSLSEKIKSRRESLSEILTELQEIGEIEVPDDLPPHQDVVKMLEEVEISLSSFGDVNMKAIQEYEEVRARRDDLLERRITLERERSEILERIDRYEQMKKDAFFETFNAVSKNFSEIIAELTDGEGELYLDNPSDPFNSGLNIRVKPYRKPVQRLESMSGGEKSLVALALIFAIQRYKPAPFYAFDEVDMFLDGVNVGRVAKMIKERSRDAQFIVVSLRKPMLEMADGIIGVTMGRDNTSTVTGIRLKARV